MNEEIISARQGALILRELLRYRELFLVLTWRDLRVRYAQTLFGLLWALLQPLLTLTILYFVFARFLQIDTGNIPPLLFMACGLAPWTYFSYVMSNSGSSIITAQAMVKKIYFPRLIIPLSKAFTGFVDFFLVLVLLFLLLWWYQLPILPSIVFLPVFIIVNMMAALGVGVWLSSLSIRFRDIQYVIPFFVQLGLYVTPVAYPSEFALQRLPPWASTLYYLNPIAGVIDGFRWSMLGTNPPSGYVWISFLSVVVIFISSIVYFHRTDGKMADLI